MSTGRDIFQRLLAGEALDRPGYVPLLRGITARVGGVGHRELTSDATIWANSLAKTAELLDLDGVVAGFHFSLLAEACGCQLAWEEDRPRVGPPPASLTSPALDQGRLAQALEATRRTFEMAKAKRGCVAAVNGPLTLAAQLFDAGEAEAGLTQIKPALVAVYEEFCKVRPDVLLLMESGPLVERTVSPALKRLYFTLKKIAAYYDVASALYIQDYRPERVADLAGLKMDVYILGPDREGGLPRPQDQVDLARDCLGVGLGLPPDDPEACRAILAEGARLFAQEPRRNLFFTSLGPLRRGHDPQTQLEIINQIRQIRR